MAKDIEKYVKKLRRKDIRMTSQRLAVLEYLAIEGNHPTAYEIYDALHPHNPNISIATIYNNLNFFKEAGILIELPFSDGSNRYDLTDSKHYHAFCDSCGKVIDFYYPELEEIESKIEKLIDFKVIDHKFKVRGLCQECQLNTQ